MEGEEVGEQHEKSAVVDDPPDVDEPFLWVGLAREAF
jgi:hypothetical protein